MILESFLLWFANVQPVGDRCLELATPDYSNFAASLFILVGILFSYLPQHYRIISRRSSEGLSPYFVLLGTTSGTSGFANILAQPVSRTDLACCKVNSDFSCFAGTLGIAQIGVQWACFTVILLLFLIYFPRASALAPPHPPSSSPPFKTAVIITGICIVHAFGQALANLIVASRYPSHLQAYADTIGCIATILASIQYFPQIWTTWRLKVVGSLSIPMMCIQTPGSYVWAASLASRMGLKGWSTWGTYLVTGLLQGILLVMCICFEVRDRKRRKEGLEPLDRDIDTGESDRMEGAGTTEDVDEETPLIADRRQQ